MNLEEILNKWEYDCTIDNELLNEEARNIPKLHLKWYRIYVDEHKKLSILKSQMKELVHYKQLYYAGELSKAALDKLGWNQFQKDITKATQKEYVDNDSQILKFNTKITDQQRICTTLESIIDQINKRNFYLKTILDFEKFKNGVV